MKRILLLFASVLSGCYCYGQGKQPIQPYVDFLKSHHTSPLDYVMDLFERYDVVVIGERNHPEFTQYEWICELISSAEFIEKVGHVMTEVGSNNYTKAINRVLSGEYATEERFEKELIGVLRDCEMQVLWYRTNYWKLLKTIYAVNCSGSPDRTLDITFLGPAWSWQEARSITRSEYEFADAMTDRQNYDVIMGENAINALYEIFLSPRKKALVILNVPHHLKGYERWPNTAAQCIMARFPGRVANVKINNFVPVYDEHGRPRAMPIADGRWDAAFALAGKKAVGFDLAGSPFGKDGFDGYEVQRPQVRQEVTYQDMFDGLIFLNPVEEMYDCSGIPGIVDEAFLPELLRRYALRGITAEEIRAIAGSDILQEFNQMKRFRVWEKERDKIEYDSIVSANFNTNN